VTGRRTLRGAELESTRSVADCCRNPSLRSDSPWMTGSILELSERRCKRCGAQLGCPTRPTGQTESPRRPVGAGLCAGAAADGSGTIRRCVVAGSRTTARAGRRTGDSSPARWRGNEASGHQRCRWPVAPGWARPMGPPRIPERPAGSSAARRPDHRNRQHQLAPVRHRPMQMTSRSAGPTQGLARVLVDRPRGMSTSDRQLAVGRGRDASRTKPGVLVGASRSSRPSRVRVRVRGRCAIRVGLNVLRVVIRWPGWGVPSSRVSPASRTLNAARG